MSLKFKCHKISEGCAEAEAIVSKDDIMFYLMKPETGEVIEPHHDLEGQGSSVVQADGLYQLNMHGNMPKGMIVKYPETVLISSAIIMEVPMVDKVEEGFYDEIKSGDIVRINADEGFIEILR